MTLPVLSAVLPTGGNASFGVQRTPTHKHQGIDLAKPKGTPVYAVTSGIVTHASGTLEPGFSGYGRHVVIHGTDGLYTLYAHLDNVLTNPGEQVKGGQMIGTVGNTCFDKTSPNKLCSGAHLHFEVSANPYPMASEAPRLDPIAYLAPQSQPTKGEDLLSVAQRAHAQGLVTAAQRRKEEGLVLLGLAGLFVVKVVRKRRHRG